MGVADMGTITVNGTTYIVVAVREFSHKGEVREAITVRLPRGKKLGEVVRYENGLLSEVAF